jgi:hypothetical protein
MASFKNEPDLNDETPSAADDQVGGDLRTSLLDAYRSQVGASAAVLSGLASTPIGAKPKAVDASGRARVDVVLAAPTKAWADAVVARLRDVLGTGVELVPMSPNIPESETPHGWNLRYCANVPGNGKDAHERVSRALASIPDVDVDYSTPIDLFVVKARP